MASTPKIIVIGGGLAGLAAVIKIAEMGGHVDLFSIVPVKRSHSVCAQGGINAAKNLKGEGDSCWQHFDDTVYGGDFLANQPPVKAMCEAAPGIIDLLDRMGVPFNRTPEGLLDFRRFGGTLFNRTAFDLTPDIQIFGQFSWNRYQGQSFYQQTPSTGVTIQRDNAYLRTYYPTIAAAATSSFSIGTSNNGFPVPGSDNNREVFRYVAGAEGKLALFGRDWKWSAYFQHGITKAHEELTNTWNTARMALAQDAVLAAAGNALGVAPGTIVCRSSLTDPANGCVPIDRLGIHGGPSAAALAYIYGPQQPYRNETIKEDVASASMSGDLFDLPGGKAALAFGGEWRKEKISGYVPAEFQPVKNANGTTTNNWLYGNYLPNFGEYTVKEGFVEVDLPVLKGVNVNAAGRYTDYTTSGSVETWSPRAFSCTVPPAISAAACSD